MTEIIGNPDEGFQAKSDKVGLTPKRLQALLIENGFPCGDAGADGKWGPETAAAVEDWFLSGTDLDPQ